MKKRNNMAQISKSFYALIIFLSLILVVTGIKLIKCTVSDDCPMNFRCPPNTFVRCISDLCTCRSLLDEQS
ncbi:putative Late nodulin [Medicago truncatula]|uniref:Putative Late nodulin n=1 Tax=Medicago truncatula TaxID=3880 RepID=I3S0B8_MEDTR|nr:unknown [Medicago truncatula]RHN79363.1 putative Late nodulin [Medicago truncatula]